jgi:hypothetical protein
MRRNAFGTSGAKTGHRPIDGPGRAGPLSKNPSIETGKDGPHDRRQKGDPCRTHDASQSPGSAPSMARSEKTAVVYHGKVGRVKRFARRGEVCKYATKLEVFGASLSNCIIEATWNSPIAPAHVVSNGGHPCPRAKPDHLCRIPGKMRFPLIIYGGRLEQLWGGRWQP